MKRDIVSAKERNIFIMENGEWRVENGGWRMEDGRWRMEDGRWRMEDGEWRMENEMPCSLEGGVIHITSIIFSFPRCLIVDFMIVNRLPAGRQVNPEFPAYT
jgi:hypothetical protein